MIDKSYVLTMARYNAWQNRQIMDIVKTMDDKPLRKDRGAFFGSISGTLNHILWGDMLWMSRFSTAVTASDVPADQNTECTPTISVWEAERFRLDGRIRIWAQALRNVDLKNDLAWYSVAQKEYFSLPLDLCIVHFFNHQTHHRGQVHAMLTSLGKPAPVTDLIYMPTDA